MKTIRFNNKKKTKKNQDLNNKANVRYGNMMINKMEINGIKIEKEFSTMCVIGPSHICNGLANWSEEILNIVKKNCYQQ